MKKITDFDKNIKITEFENFFDVYENLHDKEYAFNLNKNLYLEISDEYLKDYTLKMGMYWTTISYKLYETTRMWWLLMKINNISGKDVFRMVPSASTIRYIDTNYIEYILKTINT